MGCKHTYDCQTKISDLCPCMFLIGYDVHAVCGQKTVKKKKWKSNCNEINKKRAGRQSENL